MGKDIAERLGYERTADAIRVHVDDEDKGVGEMETPGGIQKMTIINESGLYSLVLSSKLPTAKQFKRWITSEVIPSIRKHGAYMSPDTLENMITNPEFGIKLLSALKEERTRRAELESKVEADAPRCVCCPFSACAFWQDIIVGGTVKAFHLTVGSTLSGSHSAQGFPSSTPGGCYTAQLVHLIRSPAVPFVAQHGSLPLFFCL